MGKELKQQSAVNIPNTEDDPKILIRILSIKHFYNYFSYPPMRLCYICLETGWHNLSTHTRRPWNISAILLSIWTSKLESTYSVWFGVLSSISVSATPYIDTYLQGDYPLKSIQKTGCFRERSSFWVRRHYRELVYNRPVSSWTKVKRLSFRIRWGKKEYLR